MDAYSLRQGEQLVVEFEKGRMEDGEVAMKVIYQVLRVDEQDELRTLEEVVMGSGLFL